jgi:phytoene desaturase
MCGITTENMTDSNLHQPKKVAVIGSGLGGLVSATLLAHSGFQVQVYEKNNHLGGRVNYFKKDGYHVDTGPSWLMTIDLWQQIFNVLGLDFDRDLEVIKLDPGYRVFFRGDSVIDIGSGNRGSVIEVFNQLDPGSGERLEKYLDHAACNNKVAVNWFLYRPYQFSLRNLFTKDILLNLGLLDFFKKVQSEIDKITHDYRLQLILQWIMTFVGTPPVMTPALYTLMNHYDIDGGQYYPKGGMYTIIECLVNEAKKSGVEFKVNVEVDEIIVDNNGVAMGLKLNNGQEVKSDMVISNADVVHTHQKLVPDKWHWRNDKYWNNRKHSPAAFVVYAGVNGDIANVEHHNFIFKDNASQQFQEIYHEKVWSQDPFIYFTVPSVTDSTVVPPGKNILYMLIPLAPGLQATNDYYDKVYRRALDLIATETGNDNLANQIEWYEFYTINDMKSDFYAPGGSGFGLGHTLSQSAWFRPSTVHPRVKNLYLCGQSTNPGTGMANSAISGQVVYKRIVGIKHSNPLKRSEIKFHAN